MRILIIVEPERTDWYHYLKQDKSNQYILLWHESQNDVPGWIKDESFFSEVYVWASFITPVQLLNKIKPDRIIFFEIIDQRQIALLVTANKKSVKTFYLEHGSAGDKETALKRYEVKNYFIINKRHYLFKRLTGAFGQMVKSKIFYYSAMYQLKSFNSFLKYCKMPISMLFNLPNKVLVNCIFPERIPYRSIVFNKPNFEHFQIYTGISKDQAVFTGVPFFDNYFFYKDTIGDHISYIDHPYFEDGVLEWNQAYHQKIAQYLYHFAESRQIKILVKLHPKSDLSLWQGYRFDPAFIQVVQAGDFTKKLLESKLILAYSSSMVNGFLSAQKNVVLLGWHPKPIIFGADFSKTGLCHLSLFPNELEEKFDYWINHNLSKENKTLYKEFLKDFNYPFDGLAGQRVLQTIQSL